MSGQDAAATDDRGAQPIGTAGKCGTEPDRRLLIDGEKTELIIAEVGATRAGALLDEPIGILDFAAPVMGVCA